MIRPQRYFPWKIARQFFLGHFLFVVITLVITGFSLRYYAYTEFLQTTDIHTALAKYDRYLTSLFLTVLVFSAIYLVFSTRFYARPLGRLIQRARELRRLDAPLEGELNDPDELEEEPGEWSDLERALNRIHRDLRSRTVDLSREREELSALIGAVTEAIFAVDADGWPLFFNSQFAVRFGSPEGANNQRLTLGEIFRVPEVLQGYRRVLEAGKPELVTTLLHVRDQSAPRHFSIAIAPLAVEKGRSAYGALGIFHDVTELKASEQIRIEFVANASHELRTPITSIKGYVETLRDDLKAGRYDGASQFIDIIAKNTDRLTFLVNDLLDLSVLDSGARLSKSVVPVRDVTESVIRQLDPKRASKKIEINVHYGAESVSADPARLEQVMVNLVHNAIKYIPEGKKIDVFWDSAGKNTTLHVKDNGPGVAPEHQGRLFERFYRVDAGRSRDMGGTGLGLAIVKHIMIKHGGQIRLVSRPGEGAEFICTFPNS